MDEKKKGGADSETGSRRNLRGSDSVGSPRKPRESVSKTQDSEIGSLQSSDPVGSQRKPRESVSKTQDSEIGSLQGPRKPPESVCKTSSQSKPRESVSKTTGLQSKLQGSDSVGSPGKPRESVSKTTGLQSKLQGSDSVGSPGKPPEFVSKTGYVRLQGHSEVSHSVGSPGNVRLQGSDSVGSPGKSPEFVSKTVSVRLQGSDSVGSPPESVSKTVSVRLQGSDSVGSPRKPPESVSKTQGSDSEIGESVSESIKGRFEAASEKAEEDSEKAEKDARVKYVSAQLGPEEVEPPQRSAKDAMPKTPESSSPMTNTPKIDEAQDVFSFQRMKVSEISQLLELPMNLHSLKIEGCDVLDNIPEKVMAGIPSLQRLYIINCCSLVSFPEPADLRILHIQNCKNLKFPPHAGKTSQYAFLEHLCIGSSCDSLASLPLDLFPKLRCLSIWDCKKLKSLSIQEGNQKDLTSLEALEIRDCPNLENFPEGGLPTPNLTSIWLSNCNLKELPHQLHTTLTSLRSIFVNNCPELVSLFKGDSASNLSLLSITSCDKLKLTRELGLHMLKCLIKLEIEGGCEDLVSFPEENLLPSNLISLRVSGLLNLKCLDYKGLQQLTTLKTLEISCCDKLESLPEGLPSSLSVLCIKECSLLKPKLQKQTGDYWPKIAHISFIETDEKVISRKSPV